MNDKEKQFLNDCKKDDFILKGLCASYERGKYYVYGIKNGYINHVLFCAYYGQYPFFQELDYRRYYPIESLTGGEQLSLL